jgi:hypothetical protein
MQEQMLNLKKEIKSLEEKRDKAEVKLILNNMLYSF